jgi:hypothetical protein
LPVLPALRKELVRRRNLGLRNDLLRKEVPKLWDIPTQVVTRVVSVLADALTEFSDFSPKLVRSHLFQVLVEHL